MEIASKNKPPFIKFTPAVVFLTCINIKGDVNSIGKKNAGTIISTV